MKRIKSLEHLKIESGNGGDFCILLGNGFIRSSKWIEWCLEAEVFAVFNEIDGTFQELTEIEIMDKEFTNIGEAIRKGALFKY